MNPVILPPSSPVRIGRTSTKLPIRLFEELHNHVHNLSDYGERGLSRWLSEAIVQLNENPQAVELISNDNLAKHVKKSKLNYELSNEAKACVRKLQANLSAAFVVENGQSRIIRTAIHQRLITDKQEILGLAS